MIMIHDHDIVTITCDLNLNKFYFSFYLFINHQVNNYNDSR